MPPSPEFDIPVQIGEAVELAGDSAIVIAADLDETIWATIDDHVRIMRAALRMAGVPKILIPTLEKAERQGGTRAFKYLFKNYPRANEVMRNHPRLNKNLHLIDSETPSILNQAATLGYPTILFITTRQDSLESISQQELIINGFPKAPVLARPERIDLSLTAEWKLENLVAVADRIPGTIFMVDDNLAMAKAIEQRNHPKVKPLVFQGPVTPTNHKYPSATWPTFIQSLQQIAASIS